MGVSWVLEWPMPDPAGRSLSQVIFDLEKQLLSLGAVRSGAFGVDSEPFFPNASIPGLTATIHLCHSTEFPASSFALVTEVPGLRPHLVADKTFDQLMSKLNQAFTPRPNLKVEAKGQKYDLSDFTLKICSVIIGGSARGLLVEVEYNCCFVPSLCSNLMREFCCSVLGRVGQQELSHFGKLTEQTYTPVDTISQYLSCFMKFRSVLGGMGMGVGGQQQQVLPQHQQLQQHQQSQQVLTQQQQPMQM